MLEAAKFVSFRLTYPLSTIVSARRKFPLCAVWGVLEGGVTQSYLIVSYQTQCSFDRPSESFLSSLSLCDKTNGRLLPKPESARSLHAKAQHALLVPLLFALTTL